MIDYMVMEAVMIRVQEADKKAAKEAKVKDWQKDLGSLEQYR